MARSAPENTLATRAEFFTREQTSWNALLTIWASVPPAALLLPGVCGETWSSKDLINHLAAWQEAAIRVIDELLAGRWGRLGPSIERFNAHQYAADRDRPLPDSQARLEHSRQTLIALLAALPAERLLNEYGRQNIGWWAKWTTYAHYEQHLADLAAFFAALEPPA